ncbi:MAG: DUF4112 domain-containing protein [Crocosphaera sp.]
MYWTRPSQYQGLSGTIGLDPILGLIPGGGDTIAGLLSAYIIWESARMGLNRTVLKINGLMTSANAKDKR